MPDDRVSDSTPATAAVKACPFCGATVPVTTTGFLRDHSTADGYCDGSRRFVGTDRD